MQIAIIDPDSLDAIWPRVVGFFEKGKEAWEHYTDLETIRDYIECGQYKLWVSMDIEFKAVMLTEFVHYPKVKVLRIVYIGGSEVIPHIDYIKKVFKWGRTKGAKLCEIHGSTAWKRLLESIGQNCKHTAVVHIDIEESLL